MSEVKRNKPRYLIGDVVFVRDQEIHEGRLMQGIVESAELIGEDAACWFYGIKVPIANVYGENRTVFSYQGNCGDAKTKIDSDICQLCSEDV